MSLITERTASAVPADQVAAAIAELHDRISRLPDVRPAPHVNGLFSELVRLIVDTPDGLAPAVLAHPDVRVVAGDLRQLASRAEVELEQMWARQIVASATPDAELRRFPYLDNYRKLCRVECGLIDAVLARAPRRVAFVGCGALPLTGLIDAATLGCSVVNIDRDESALPAAADVTSAVRARGIDFRVGDASEMDVSGFDVVVLAAMVGTTDDEKRAVLAHLRESISPDSALIARSARGLRTLLYPQIADDALAGFDVRAVVHPVTEVINSVVLARPVG